MYFYYVNILRICALASLLPLWYSLPYMIDLVGVVLPYIQVALSLLLIAAIILQQSSAGLGGAFGGSDDAVHHTRRGGEKTLFQATFVIAILFVLSTFAALLV